MNEQEVELLLQELQNRIGQQAARYEGELAMLKVQASTKISTLEKEIEELKKDG